MSLLNPTAPEDLVDGQGRPYFLWDIDMSLDRFRALLASGEPAQRAYLVGKLMRQAKPDDVFSFVSLAELRAIFPDARPYLGRTRPFWDWLLAAWSDDREA